MRRYFDKRSGYLIAVFASCVLCCTIFFIQNPVDLFVGNTVEFSYSILSLIKIYAPWIVFGVLVPLVPALLLPKRILGYYSACIVALAVSVWTQNSFFIHDFGMLDGQNWAVRISKARSTLEAIGAIVLFCSAFAFAFLYRRASTAAAAILSALALGSSLTHLWMMDTVAKEYKYNVKEAYSFSSEKNILVILLDSMQSDFLEEIAAEEPKVRQALDGFIYFPDTTGVSTSTYLAVPTIHSGREYKIGASINDHYQKSVVEGSFINKLADAGYKSAMVGPLLGVCPQKADLCLDTRVVLYGEDSEQREQAATLLNLSLLRIAPAFLKEYIYNDGLWRISLKKSEDESDSQAAVVGNRMMKDLGARLTVGSAQPTVKFFHLMSTHLPVVYNNKCNFVAEKIKLTRDSFKAQVRCALLSFTDLIEDLKRKNVLDNTGIVLLADHGSHGGWPHPKASGNEEIPSYLIGVSNPAFAVKPFNASGPMKISNRLVSLTDIAATVCDLSLACKADFGATVLENNSRTTRTFLSYTWARGLKGTDSLSDIVSHQIRGSLFNVDNWTREPRSIEPNTIINFTTGGNSRAYTGRGWVYGAEKDGSRTKNMRSEVIFRLEDRKSSHLMVAITAQTMSPRSVDVLMNDEKIGQMDFADSQEAKEFRFAAPMLDATEGSVFTLAFRPSNPIEADKSGTALKVKSIVLGEI